MYIGNINSKKELDDVVANKDYTRCYAIRLKCLECKSYVVRDISKCDNINCPLYRYRKGYGK